MTNHDHVILSRDHLSEFQQKTFNIVTYFQINILFHDAYDTLNILLYSIYLFFLLSENNDHIGFAHQKIILVTYVGDERC